MLRENARVMIKDVSILSGLTKSERKIAARTTGVIKYAPKKGDTGYLVWYASLGILVATTASNLTVLLDNDV